MPTQSSHAQKYVKALNACLSCYDGPVPQHLGLQLISLADQLGHKLDELIRDAESAAEDMQRVGTDLAKGFRPQIHVNRAVDLYRAEAEWNAEVRSFRATLRISCGIECARAFDECTKAYDKCEQA